MDRLARQPFILTLMGIGAIAMFLPAIHAYHVRDLHEARSFFYSGALLMVFVTLVCIAVASGRRRRRAAGLLLSLVATLIVLPPILAMPFYEALGDVSWIECWFEMVSALTTTGATMFPDPGGLPDSLHLWRGLVAWLGGLLFWIGAVAILAPLNLGGFEVVTIDQLSARRSVLRERGSGDAVERLHRYTVRLTPIYVGLTLTLWTLLVLVGHEPLDGAILAMSTLSTSGITAGTVTEGPFAAEFVIAIFLVFALSRLTFQTDGIVRRPGYMFRDPEIRLSLFLILAVTAFLFLRHWVGAFEEEDQEDLAAAGRALWGTIFTTISFLTTTGFESAAFVHARDWSGLQTTGLVLMGLALVGGGVATTAGGVKLLRIYALYKHGRREMERLVHPSSIGGSGAVGRRLRREGAFVAWIFFMLFAISLAVIMAALTLAGQDFEESLILTISALSTTGPVAEVAGEVPIRFADLSTSAQVITALAMILGRLETLAFIALFNRGFWHS
ncbi:trk system potassium uptake protein TrkH [Palleronia aestuarii]|uniref:Trk system potassium uptake protein TrkH n=1 Tax=Palleronia aestuarii TaxID=568105 RepID=A0A2W7NKH1_9RHOB|nr:potassium transporter TrkG [Palleronia aestuarii]PZX19953.1 trk system potassium uptake protein TrkH [Palleronia aestuarii]